MSESLESILSHYRKGEKGVLLAILHRIQEAQGYISQEAVEVVAAHLGMSPARVYGVVTFYSEFYTSPPGETVVSICLGPTCHLRGGERIKCAFESLLGVKVEGEPARGGVTPNGGGVSLRIEQCPGICHLAPTVRINGVLYDRVREGDVSRIVEEMRGV